MVSLCPKADKVYNTTGQHGSVSYIGENFFATEGSSMDVRTSRSNTETAPTVTAKEITSTSLFAPAVNRDSDTACQHWLISKQEIHLDDATGHLTNCTHRQDDHIH